MRDDFRVLFVDDEQKFLDVTAELLRRSGYPCEAVTSVEAAWDLWAQQSFDLVIADIKMSGNCELEFVQQLALKASDTSFILVTGFPSIASAVRSVELPVVAYLIKPFKFQDLLEKVRAAEQSTIVMRGVRQELIRLQSQCRSLESLELRLQQPPRLTPADSLDAFCNVTLRHLREGLIGLQRILDEAVGPESSLPGRSHSERSGEVRDALRDAVQTLERTKGAFKSKELGDLRRRLEGLLEHFSRT